MTKSLLCKKNLVPKRPLKEPSIMFLFFIIFFFLIQGTYSAVNNTIDVHQNITDGKTIVSGNGIYEMGFFGLGRSKNQYLGIWFKNTNPRKAVWVANRKTPLKNTLGVLKLNNQGILSLFKVGGIVIWSSKPPSSSSKNVSPIAQLLDSGNFEVRDENGGVVWQSFDDPGDTYLPGMKVGKNLVTGREMYLMSWRSVDDPSPGEYTMKLSTVKGKYPQLYLRKNSVIQARIGPYQGLQFAGLPVYSFFEHKFDMVVNHKEIYLVSTFNSITYSFRCILTPGGKFEISHMDMQNHLWNPVASFPKENCDTYALCGPYGSCSTAIFPNCKCLKGFERDNSPLPSQKNWTSGCRRSKALNCGPGERFFKLSSMKLPDTRNATFNGSTNIEECEMACKNNCACIAYANNLTEGGVGCLLWFGELIDVRVYPDNGQDLYIRLAASEFLDLRSSAHGKKKLVIRTTLSILAGLIFLALIMALYIWRKKRRSDAESEGIVVNVVQDDDQNRSSKRRSIEVPVFSLTTIASATNNFSNYNKLGEGGFGPVYKGELEEGQQIAVKRLSKFSQQGLDEFKNEVTCIAKLQHRNLVKLLGFCIQGDETMLIYEYMTNKSLDWFIFDDSRKSLLDWPRRFHIIQGIARGLLYLHQDSRLRIVHRDLKAGNILLDDDMNPKISDFGLARVFKEHESERKTKRVVGTLGYIPPEYAVNGLFSVKSDIFSFGVLVLEIVCGKKNRAFVHANHHDNLLGHAWRLHHEGKSLDLVDTALGKSYSASEVLRSVHIGLLCVQQRPEDRPSTPFVVSMLGYGGSLPSPKLPGLFIEGDNGSTSNLVFPPSVNGITVSLVEGRE